MSRAFAVDRRIGGKKQKDLYACAQPSSKRNTSSNIEDVWCFEVAEPWSQDTRLATTAAPYETNFRRL